MASALAQTAAALERIQAILGADDIIRDDPAAIDPPRASGAIVLEHVAFGYADDAVLRDVSFAIEPGQTVGIVGPIGSGKSTVVSLIARFYEPTAGRVLIDGTDIRRYRLGALRAQIGVVLQETVLFRGGVADNVAYGKPDATRAEIVAAAKVANADEFIVRMPHGYDSLVGERGDTLSGGRRQRIGIARAMIRDSPILILDEPTAALDTASEHLVIEALTRLMQGRTIVMIAHRMNTLRDADAIVARKDGCITEQGTHAGLLAQDGVYAELHRSQYAARGGARRRESTRMSHRLIVLPDDGARPFLDAIEGAGHALDIRMFVFNDPGLLPAVAAARRRGVVVRVMLNRARRNGCDDNIGSRRLLADAGTDVRDSHPKFDLTHQKSMVVDGATGFIASLNWELGNEEPDGHARLGRRHRTSTRDARNDALLRGRLAALRFPAGTVVQPDLVPGQWTPANCQLHRHCPTFAVVQTSTTRTP